MPELKPFIATSSLEHQPRVHSSVPSCARASRTGRLPHIVVSLLLLLVFAIFLLGPAQVAEVQSNESRCFDLVQQHIAWNYKGDKSWSPTNVQDLCRGTSNPAQPARCFHRVMHGGIDWGGGTQWQWENARDLCVGTNDAEGTISCFQAKIREGIAWSEATRTCNERRCSGLVQGQIAWNYQGDKTWAAANVQNLCRGTSNPTQPPRCFERAMNGGINWGGGTRWQWENALALCGGSSNAGNTISCFQAKIGDGVGWSDAIKACKGEGG